MAQLGKPALLIHSQTHCSLWDRKWNEELSFNICIHKKEKWRKQAYEASWRYFLPFIASAWIKPFRL